MNIHQIMPWIKSPPRLTSDTQNPLNVRGTRDGIPFVGSWRQAQIMDGRGFISVVGSLSSPITGGGAGTVLDLDQPEFIVSVPSGTTIVPVRVHIQTQTPLLATDADETEILLAVDKSAAAVDDGTKTAETAFNLVTNHTRTSDCTVTSAYTADVTDPVLSIELARSVLVGDVQGTAATALWTKNEVLYVPAEDAPFIVGPAMLIGYWGGTVATTGFAQISWIEIPTTDLS